MKLVRYGAKGKEKPGLIDKEGKLRDLSGVVPDITSAQLSSAALSKLAKIKTSTLPLVKGKPRYGVPLADVGKFLAIGLNYSDHAAEAGMPCPKEPIIFFKADTSLSGPNDPVMLPKGSKKSDWEVELGVVIVSEREYQLERGGTWDKGKGCDTFGPVGPWLVTADEIKDPQKLGMWLDVNGKRFQTGTTKTMIFDVQTIVSYVSEFMTLMPGDIITTGTPPGVGMGVKPKPRYLKAGDVMTLGIDGLGEQRQEVVAFKK